MRPKTFAFVPEVFTIDGAAHYLGVSKRTVEEYIAKGALHTYRLPPIEEGQEFLRRTLIRRGTLDKFIARGMEV